MRRSNAKTQAFDPPPPKMEPSKPHLRPKSRRCRCLCCSPSLLFTASAVALAFLLLYLLIPSHPPASPSFSIFIDGGSTGTRIHVFAYRIRSGFLPVVDFGLSGSLKVGPGLSFYAEDPDEAGESLVKLVEFAKGIVPSDLWAETEIRLMGTAGLRLVDGGAREKILDSCRRVLRVSGFRFEDDWATVITGRVKTVKMAQISSILVWERGIFNSQGVDEGIYAWIAANYALGTIGGDPQKTTGIFELGGASAQVTFVSSEPLPPEFLHVLEFGEVKYNLYSHSFLHLGQNVAHESLQELLSPKDLKTPANLVQPATFKDPCTPRGYLHDGEPLKLSDSALSLKMNYRPVAHAVGNFSECRSAALMLLQKGKDKCMYSSCLLGSSFIPNLQGRFIATENFFYTSRFFGLGSASFLSDLVLAGERFCEEDWSELTKRYPTLEKEELLRYCFSSAYIVALLHDSLGIAMNDRRIQFANQVGNVPLDWALGAFIMQKTSNQSNAESSGWLTNFIGEDSSVYLPLFIGFMILIFAVWSLSRWRKPQSKMIYDLEKGRYITKRILKR